MKIYSKLCVGSSVHQPLICNWYLTKNKQTNNTIKIDFKILREAYTCLNGIPDCISSKHTSLMGMALITKNT